MKTNIRIGVFETNSSSTHSLCIATKEQYEKLQKGELLINYSGDLIETTEEAKEDEDNQTLDVWLDDDELETSTTNYKTPGGEELVIMCKYGYNG